MTKPNIMQSSSRLKEVQRRADEISARELHTALPPQYLFLPGVGDFVRVMPNHLARSSLFSPTARGREIVHDGAELITRADAQILYWGLQLDEPMADVWMQALHEAMAKPLGLPVTIKRASFLRAIGRHAGKYEYDWLHRSMQSLANAKIAIEVRSHNNIKLDIGRDNPLHLIKSYYLDKITSEWTICFDQRWHKMFGKEYARIDWKQRLQFGLSKDMAKALQRLIATSNEKTQRYAVDWLQGKLQFKSPLCKFKKALQSALLELERVEIIAGARIVISTKGKEQAVWTRL